jgi:hypothetical protein
MFARFRQVRDRLNVSLVEAVRTGAKIRQSHIANLGSVPHTPSPADRVRFWIKVHQRLATLSNRLDEATRETVLAAIHARIPIPTAEDQEAARNSGRQANAALFATLRDKHRGLADVYHQGAEREAAAAEAVDGLEAAYVSRPMTQAEMRRFLKSLGMTAAELRHRKDLNAVCELLGEDRIVPMLAKEGVQAGDRATRRAVRSLLTALTQPRPRRPAATQRPDPLAKYLWPTPKRPD